jgi:hypothetical protein
MAKKKTGQQAAKGEKAKKAAEPEKPQEQGERIPASRNSLLVGRPLQENRH